MGRSTDKETRLSEQRKYRSWTAQQKLEIVLAGLRGDRSGQGGLPRARDLGDALLRLARQAARGRPRGAGRQGGAPGRAGAAPEGRASSSGRWAGRPTSSRSREKHCGLGVSVRVARSRELVAEGYAARGRGARAADQPAGALPDADAEDGRRSGGRRPIRSRPRSSRRRWPTRPTATGWSARSSAGGSAGAVNRKRVLRVMRERKLIQRRRPLERRKRPGFFRVERPRQLWQLDMTSVWVAEHGWCYLNAIIDCCTREIVAWQLELRCRADEAIALVERAAAAHGIEPGELSLGSRQRLGLHRPPLPRPPRRARDPPPPRRLPRPREPGLHRELVRETQREGGVAERVRDPRRRPPRDRRLRRPLPPPAPLGARLPDTRRGRPDLGGSTKNMRPSLSTPAGSRSATRPTRPLVHGIALSVTGIGPGSKTRDGPHAHATHRVLPRGCHDWSISFPQDRAWRRSLQETQGSFNRHRDEPMVGRPEARGDAVSVPSDPEVVATPRNGTNRELDDSRGAARRARRWRKAQRGVGVSRSCMCGRVRRSRRRGGTSFAKAFVHERRRVVAQFTGGASRRAPRDAAGSATAEAPAGEADRGTGESAERANDERHEALSHSRRCAEILANAAGRPPVSLFGTTSPI